jgi:putative SOS response-associated peptidase YedK
VPPNPRYKIAPTQRIPAVLHDSDFTRHFAELRWGLIPNWSGGPKEFKKLLINARGETVAHLPSFEHAFRAQRCLVLVDGFYEWKRDGKNKQPYYIQKPGGEPFAFAGLTTFQHEDKMKPKNECASHWTSARQGTQAFGLGGGPS